MTNKKIELMTIEIEDLKNQVYRVKQDIESLTKVLLDTLGVKALRRPAILVSSDQTNEDGSDSEDCLILEEVTIREVLEDLKE